MPRHPKADKPVEKTINIPTSVCTKVDLILFSELEMRVPHGAWSRYICNLIDQDLARRQSEKTTPPTAGQVLIGD